MVNLVRRPVMFVVTALLMFATLLVIPSMTVFAATGEEVSSLEAKPDQFKFWAGTNISDLEVYVNDPAWGVDGAEIGDLQKPELDDGTTIRLHNGGIWIIIDSRRTEDITFSYKWVNETSGEEGNWAEVTIDVKKTVDIRVKQPSRLKIKLINPNSARVQCMVGSNSESTPDIDVGVKANSSRVVTNKHHHRTMYLYCYIGKYYAMVTDRVLRNLKV